ncbi:VOC family protein [Cellulomonas sp. NTE-D12]|uniref:VOC family protein n=1 Tax=Cellulomonas sp. NTE-D12 TaxID=2962632 RepID=UPI0030818650|nr:glyoxalase [Cellulomonas sp. NTE-D12]
MSTITGIRTVAVPVADQDRALAFYRDVLGFEVRLDGLAAGGRWVEVGPAGGSVTLALTRADGSPSARGTGIRFTAPDAAAERASLARAGLRVGDLLRWPGVPPMFTFDDPDGNQFVVVEQTAGDPR